MQTYVLKLVYLHYLCRLPHVPNANGDTIDGDAFTHLAELCVLDKLVKVDVTGADFFGHSLFQLLEVRGDQLSTLALNEVDEMNLNGVILIGDRCPNLTELTLIKCYYQMEIEDSQAVDRLIKERFQNNSASPKCHRSSGNSKSNTPS